MTVEELIEALGCYDKDYEVIINYSNPGENVLEVHSNVKCVHGDSIKEIVNIDTY